MSNVVRDKKIAKLLSGVDLLLCTCPRRDSGEGSIGSGWASLPRTRLLI